MKITIIGSTGQFGTDLMEILSKEHEVTGLGHQDIEIADFNSCQILKQDRPDVIISTAAFHKTDQCEKEPLRTFSVNALGARNITMISKELDSTVVFISTDYVFDGSKNEPYTEDDTPYPLNTYGISKLAAECFIKQNPKYYIIRIASVFGVAGASGKGGNFVETMITKAKNNEIINVVDDMWMSPTYTKDAASILKGILEYKLPFGIYHATNTGCCSWYEFAREIFRILGLNPILNPVKADPNYGLARRPRFSALRSTKLSDYKLESREWKKALYAYLIEKGYI
ncbi:MAG: dTDP-4-dehydrorhamnose reductase [Candidatus Bathyarchaeota archaeon]